MDNITGGSQQFCLRWNNHQHNLLTVFDNLLQNESFVDVTIAVEGMIMKAHKMVLSACSPYFESLFVNSPDKHPIVFLKDVKFIEMKALLDFMYKGEVSVDQEDLSSLLKVAESLRIKGLTEVSEQKSAEAAAAAKYQMRLGEPPAKKMVTALSSILPLNPTPLAKITSIQNMGTLKRKRGRPRTLSPTIAHSKLENTADSPALPIPPVDNTEEVLVNHKNNADEKQGLTLSKIPSTNEAADGSLTVSPNSEMTDDDKPVDLKIECKEEPQAADHSSPTGCSDEQMSNKDDATSSKEEGTKLVEKTELDDSRESETSGGRMSEEAVDGGMSFIDVEGGLVDPTFTEVKVGKRSRSGELMEGPPYICKECGKEFPAQKALTRHRDRNHSLITHPCKECGAIFKRTDHLSRHVRSVHGLVCQLCQNVFVGKENYNQHMLDAHHMNLLSPNSTFETPLFHPDAIESSGYASLWKT